MSAPAGHLWAVPDDDARPGEAQARRDLGRMIAVASTVLESRACKSLSLPDVARTADVRLDQAQQAFGDEAGLVRAVREAERERMIGAMARAENAGHLNPLTTIREAIGRAGRLMEEDIVVRAGVRLAMTWTPRMPGPQPDPGGLWRPFLARNLKEAWRLGLVPASTEPFAAADYLAGVGLAVRDHIARTGSLTGIASTLSHDVDRVLGAWETVARVSARPRSPTSPKSG